MQSAACHRTNKGTAHNVPQLKCTQNYFIIRTNVAQWQLQAPSSAAAPARACPHATCRMPLRHLVQLCSGHPAPESEPRPSSCQRDSGGPVSISKRGSTTPQHSSHNICAGEGPPAPPLYQSAHPAFYHVICYPTIYNCIKTHALRDYFQLQIQFSGTTLNEHGSSIAPSPTKPSNCPIQFYAMFNILYIFPSRSHVVGAVVVGPNLILDWLITACLSLLLDLWIFKSIWQLTRGLRVLYEEYCTVGRQIIDGHGKETHVMCRYDGYICVYVW